MKRQRGNSFALLLEVCWFSKNFNKKIQPVVHISHGPRENKNYKTAVDKRQTSAFPLGLVMKNTTLKLSSVSFTV